jgi:GTP-binding protein
VLVTSSATGSGIEELSKVLVRMVPEVEPVVAEIPEGRTIYRPAERRGFVVDRDADGTFVVSGSGIEQLVGRFDIENDEAMEELERRLRSIGVMGALEEAGFKSGDDVEIGGVLFELDPDDID